MPRFLFLTTLTPRKLSTPLRRDLSKLYRKALLQQDYPDWQALMIGEEDRREGNLREVETSAVTKEEKLRAGWEFIERMPDKPRYVIRLDDDDLISPTVLSRAAALDFDCLADRYHWRFDLVSARYCPQKRDWLPNTCIHAYAHAFQPYGESGLPLLLHDHSKAWHSYYADKELRYTPRKDPVYLRIVSPSTITSGYLEGTPHDRVEHMDLVGYRKRMSRLKWHTRGPRAFSAHQRELERIWEEFSGQKQPGRRAWLDRLWRH